MSVVSITDHPDSGKGSDSTDESRRQRMLLVKTNSRDDGANVILANAGIPQRGAFYNFRNESLLTCICRERAVDHLGLIPGGRLFLATCDYTTKYDEGDQNEEEENPLAVPAKIATGNTQVFRKVVTKDKDGADIVNSAKQPFLDLPEDDHHHYTLTIIRNEAYVDADLIKEYTGSVNSDAWKGGAAREWLIDSIAHGPAQWQAGIRYYEFHYSFLRNFDTWDLELVDLGKQCFLAPASDGKLINCKDFYGHGVDGPFRLDGTGFQLNPTQPNVYRTFRRKKEKTFASLGLEGAQ